MYTYIYIIHNTFHTKTKYNFPFKFYNNFEKLYKEGVHLTLLNIVVREGATILKLFTSEDQTLLIRRDTCKIVNQQ